MVGLHRVCHIIIFLGIIHDQTTSGITWYHRPWNAHTIGQRRAWYARMDLGRPHGQMMSGVECHLRIWEAYTVGRHLV